MVLALKQSNISDTIVIINQVDPATIHVTYSFVTTRLDSSINPSYNTVLLPFKKGDSVELYPSSLYSNDLESVNNTINYIYDRMVSFYPNHSEPTRHTNTIKPDDIYLHCANEITELDKFIEFMDWNHGPDYIIKYLPELNSAIKRITKTFGSDNKFLYYTFRELLEPTRIYVAYSMYNCDGIIWLPTCHNNPKTLKIDKTIKRDMTILWGGVSSKHIGCKIINPPPLPSYYSPVPKYIYGIVNFATTYPNSNFENGYIGIDLANTDSNNMLINQDSEAIHFESIF
jgi:hypothetical protein